MGILRKQIEAYEEMREELEAQHFRKWVVFHDGQFEGAYPSFDEAADDACRKFGREPFLVRQVAAPPIRLLSTVQFGTMQAVS